MDNKKLILETIGFFLGFTILVFVIGSCLTGCASHIEAETETGTPLGHSRFYVYEGKGPGFDNEIILVDSETGVQYLYVSTIYRAGLTVLVDRDGKPLIAEGYKDY